MLVLMLVLMFWVGDVVVIVGDVVVMVGDVGVDVLGW